MKHVKRISIYQFSVHISILSYVYYRIYMNIVYTNVMIIMKTI